MNALVHPVALALLCCLAAVVVALPGHRSIRARLGRLVALSSGPPRDPATDPATGPAAGTVPGRATGEGPHGPAREPSPPWWRRRGNARWAAAALAGIATALIVEGWLGVVGAVVTTVTAGWTLNRLEPASERAERVACVADLPLAADLMAAALRAGAPVDRAALAVAEALGGPLAGRMAKAGRSLRLGAEPAEAWDHLADVPGCRRLIAATVRSRSSGAALAGALLRLAEDLRADRAAEAEAAARRAGVLIVLPLGLCFLPAFVLAGLAPIVVAVLGGVL